MKKFFAAMVLAGLVAVPMTFAQEKGTDQPKKEKKAGKKKGGKKKAEEPKQQ